MNLDDTSGATAVARQQGSLNDPNKHQFGRCIVKQKVIIRIISIDSRMLSKKSC